MPRMQNYYENYKDYANVEIIVVNLTTEERGLVSIEKFIDTHELTFPVPLDIEGEVIDIYEIKTIPTTNIINMKGTIKEKVMGPMDVETTKKLVDNLDLMKLNS